MTNTTDTPDTTDTTATPHAREQHRRARIRRGPAGPQPDLSVVIVHWNTPDLLRSCVLSLRDGLRGIENEVIVVDNGSTGTAAPTVWPGPGLQLVHLGENRGFAAAANRGASIARGRSILFLNSDVRLSPRSGSKLLTALASDSRLAAVAACAECEDRTRHYPGLRFLTPFNHALGLLGLRRRRELTAQTEHAEQGEHTEQADEAAAHAPRVVPWVRASTMLVRRDAFAAVGGFDEGFFFYEEDEDLCWRLARRGYRSAVAENVTVPDVGGASTKLAKRVDDWPTRALYAGQLRFVRRRLGRGAVAPYRLSISIALAVKILAATLLARRSTARNYFQVLRSLWALAPRLVTKAA